MSKTRVPQNLPPDSQQWVRDIERRLNDLETQNQRLTRSVTQNAGQIHDIQEGVRSARGGTQSLDISRIVSDTGTDFVESRLEVPAWARSVSIIAPLSVYNRGTAGNISASLGVYVLSGGPDREIASIASIEATNRGVVPAPNSNNSATTSRTAAILPGDTHISLRGTCSWSNIPELLGIKPGTILWSLTVFWSANPYSEESI